MVRGVAKIVGGGGAQLLELIVNWHLDLGVPVIGYWLRVALNCTDFE